MSKIKIEGLTVQEIFTWPESYFDELVLLDQPIVIRIGTAEVLGQFAINGTKLVVELAQIEGGGEGILLSISRLSKHVAKMKGLESIDCIVHAINCAKPNLKLRAYLERAGFVVTQVPEKGEAYFKNIPV